MATKRPHSATAIHPSRAGQVPADPSNRVAKKRKQNPHPGRSLQPKSHPINPLKSRIRSLQRLLDHDEGVEKGGMDAGVRIGRERELKSLEWDLAEAQKEEARRKMVGRWHMVRFFDRQKATRRLKRAERKLKEDGTGDRELKEQVRRARVDWNYALYFPLDLPYSSLWPTTGKKKSKSQGEDEEETEDGDERQEEKGDKDDESKGDIEMKQLVEQCMRDKRLDDLRNGKVVPPKSSMKEAPEQATSHRSVSRKAEKSRRKGKQDVDLEDEKHGKASKAEQDGEDSDGGFFE